MATTRSITFSCDHPDGCFAHATVAGDDITEARNSLHEALGWITDERGDICPRHDR